MNDFSSDTLAQVDGLIAWINQQPESRHADLIAGIQPTVLRNMLIEVMAAQKHLADEPPSGFTGELPDLPPGTRFGPYLLVDRVGQGSFGVVYHAKQQLGNSQRSVAIKILRIPLGAGVDRAHAKAFFLKEIEVLSRLTHDNILRVIAADTWQLSKGGPEFPYIVTEWIAGKSIVSGTRGWTTRAKLELFIPVCRGVQYAHRQDVVHCDLKPDNILVTEGIPPKAVVLDFGLAAIVKGPIDLVFPGLTLIYASPEQIDPESGPRGPASDVYSLAVVLFEMLTGTLPYRLPVKEYLTESLLLRAINSPDCRLSLDSFAGFESSLSQILANALQRDPHRRTPAPENLAVALEGWLKQDQARPASILPPAPPATATHVTNNNATSGGIIGNRDVIINLGGGPGADLAAVRDLLSRRATAPSQPERHG